MAEIKALVVAEHDNSGIRPATLKVVTAAGKLGGEVHVLIAGAGSAGAASAAAAVGGVSKVLHAEGEPSEVVEAQAGRGHEVCSFR